jgi:hypothetical protein
MEVVLAMPGKDLSSRILARERAGEETGCSHQIFAEVLWLVDGALDLPRAAKRLDDLEFVLAHPEQEARAREQDPSDGSWGACHEQWFFRVNATIEHLQTQAARAETPRYEMHLFDRVNSPEKLREYFEGVSVSDIARTGRDNRWELNESLENLGRLILQGRPAYCHWHPQLKAVLADLILNRLRNPRTGWWGERFRRSGREEFVDDLSMTYHVISALIRDVPDMVKVMDHLPAVKDLDYEVGWLQSGHYSNHHNMDVIALFGYGWPYMTDAQQDAAAAEIRKMVNWCVRDSLQPDGSFRQQGVSDDSVEEHTYWGASFLARAGYFDAAKRFWTRDPQAEKVRQRIVRYIEQHRGTGGAGGNYYEGALEQMGALTVPPLR